MTVGENIRRIRQERNLTQRQLGEMNKELAGKGFLTIAGKIPVEYFREKWYGGAKEVSA